WRSGARLAARWRAGRAGRVLRKRRRPNSSGDVLRGSGVPAVRGRHGVERADVRGAAARTGTDGADTRHGRRLDFRAPVCAGRRAPLNPYSLMWKQASLHGIRVGTRGMFLQMNRAVEANGIKPVINTVVPFESAVDAWRLQVSGNFIGKIVISLSEAM